MWNEYAKQKGGLHHTDRLLATIATQANRLSGGEADIGDFLPELKTRADEKEADIGEIMNLLTLAAN